MAEHPILTAQITQDDSGVTLYCPELNIHTSGKSESQVRRKFVDALFDYYRFLEAHDFKNESPYKEHFAFLMGEVLPSLNHHDDGGYGRQHDPVQDDGLHLGCARLGR